MAILFEMGSRTRSLLSLNNTRASATMVYCPFKTQLWVFLRRCSGSGINHLKIPADSYRSLRCLERVHADFNPQLKHLQWDIRDDNAGWLRSWNSPETYAGCWDSGAVRKVPVFKKEKYGFPNSTASSAVSQKPSRNTRNSRSVKSRGGGNPPGVCVERWNCGGVSWLSVSMNPHWVLAETMKSSPVPPLLGTAAKFFALSAPRSCKKPAWNTL